MDVKANRVYFSAYLGSFGEVTGKLTFPNIVLNLGNKFDGNTGTFEAPVQGVYRFSFSGQQPGGPSDAAQDMNVKVMVNDVQLFSMMDDRNTKDENQKFQNLSYNFELRLDQNDKVYLTIESGDYLYTDRIMRLFFSGELIIAD